ncbi:MAG: hypothetical protein U1F68_11055 [Gammaproteobacteria bacterium]
MAWALDSVVAERSTAAADTPLMKRLTVTDLEAIVALQEAVRAGLPLGFIRSKDASELRAYLDDTLGVAYGIAEEGALLAMALLRVPHENHPNGSTGVPFPIVPAADWPLRACILENSMVVPAARGRGYQRALLAARRAHALSVRMKWICAGVHLQNVVSWANLLASGMAIVGIRFDRGYPIVGLLGSVDGQALASSARDQVAVRMDDPSQHQAALRDGYIGVRRAAADRVIYQRAAAPCV